MAYEIIPISDGFWAIQDGNVRMYLLDGGDAALLVDTGYGSGDLLQTVQGLVKGTVYVVNTHSHNDHTSGNGQFEHFFMSKADAPEIFPYCPPNASIQTVRDGDQICVGDLRLEVLAIPGHTPGAIALLDRQRRLLFSGDSFAKFYPIYMQFPGQNLEQYLASLQRMLTLCNAFDRICPHHGELEIEKDYMEKTVCCVEGILAKTIQPGTAPLYDGTASRAFWFEDVAIFY